MVSVDAAGSSDTDTSQKSRTFIRSTFNYHCIVNMGIVTNYTSKVTLLELSTRSDQCRILWLEIQITGLVWKSSTPSNRMFLVNPPTARVRYLRYTSSLVVKNNHQFYTHHIGASCGFISFHLFWLFILFWPPDRSRAPSNHLLLIIYC